MENKINAARIYLSREEQSEALENVKRVADNPSLITDPIERREAFVSGLVVHRAVLYGRGFRPSEILERVHEIKMGHNDAPRKTRLKFIEGMNNCAQSLIPQPEQATDVSQSVFDVESIWLGLPSMESEQIYELAETA